MSAASCSATLPSCSATLPELAPRLSVSRRSKRPSLLELANSSSLVNEMQNTFKSSHAPGSQLLQLRTRCLKVGRCGNEFAGVARFYPTEVVYTFDHPIHRKVEMHMRYGDMIEPRLMRTRAGSSSGSGGGRGERRFSFRINKRLEYFSREYDPADPEHQLHLHFQSDADASQFEQRALPHILTLSAS